MKKGSKTMIELKKVEDSIYTEVYEAENIVIRKKDWAAVTRKVICILDDNKVCYIVLEDGKRKRISEFNNAQKAMCFANATKALNRE